MEMKWTDRQRQVIESRNKNLLVSAAAGSGKTAVLVERIIRMILDDTDKTDVDRILVVTFTKAAASQMREKILGALLKKSSQFPDDEHLQKQLTYIHNSKIMTIDSFCLSIVKEHFTEIDIDPGFRVADEGELNLIKADVLSEMLEEKYEEGSEEFLEFVETYVPKNDDGRIEDLILKLYGFCISHPWPAEWLKDCEKAYSGNGDDFWEAEWAVSLEEYMDTMLRDYGRIIENGIAICEGPLGPYAYTATLMQDFEMIEAMRKNRDFDSRAAVLRDPGFGRLPPQKGEDFSPDLKKEVTDLRKKVKDGLKAMGKDYFFQDREFMSEDMHKSAGPTKILIGLTAEFLTRYAQAKREKNLVDFSDIEHMALQILTGKDHEGGLIPSQTAKEISETFREIFIDEYQDSNLLQEMILRSVSRESRGCPNTFMVGDIKQSIYKFRMAKPELFVKKYEEYPTQDTGLYQRISLDKNFRSRDTVLKGINYIFRQIMSKNLGDIDYDEDNELYTGAEYDPVPPGQTDKTEVLLVEAKADKKELEAQVIADRIRELTDPVTGYKIIDRKTGEFRTVRFSDIVILYRSPKGNADITEKILMTAGIPCYVETREGYFDAIEVRTVLDLLSIIDNPVQDISLSAVLRSPVAGFSSNDLAKIRILCKKETMYVGILRYVMEGEDEELKKRLNLFLEKLESYRQKAIFLSIYELMTFVLKDTGYELYVRAMPAGERRKANLEMLKEKASAFEQTSYTGVFNFIRYIEKLRKYKENDIGEASIVGENDETVRIMSIHKSKGLEFPVVIIGGTGKKFNNMDAADSIVMHSDLGIGVDYIDLDLRVKTPTLIKKGIALKVKLENLSEELRVLYVAMTRAKEKLIIVGQLDNLEKSLQKWMAVRQQNSTSLSLATLLDSGSFINWIGYALVRSPSFSKILKSRMPEMEGMVRLLGPEDEFDVYIFRTEDIVYEKVKKTVLDKDKEESLINWDSPKVSDEKIRLEMKSRIEYSYPFAASQSIHTKMSVSEIKKVSQQIDEEKTLWYDRDWNRLGGIVPQFVSKEEGLSGSGRGSAYHHVLELLDFSLDPKRDSIVRAIARLESEGRISREEAGAINSSDLMMLFSSDLGKRLSTAYMNKKLYREKQFVMSVPASQIRPSYDPQETVLVQGVIDAYFEEGDLVIIDYKTDKVENMQELEKRYGVQLDFYQKALEQITGKTVKEKILYSFHLGKGETIK